MKQTPTTSPSEPLASAAAPETSAAPAAPQKSARAPKDRRRPTLPAEIPAVRTHNTVTAFLSLPAETAADPEIPRLQAAAISPFEDIDTAYGYEVVGAHGDTMDIFLAVASVNSLSDPWYAWLDSRDLLGRIPLDISALGWLTAMRGRNAELSDGCAFVALLTEDERFLAILKDGFPKRLRALPPNITEADLGRETTLLTAQAALNDGLVPDRAFAFIGPGESSTALGTALGLTVSDTPLADTAAAEAMLQEGLRARAESGAATFDLTPESWKAEAAARRTRRILTAVVSILGVVWLLCAAALILMPKIYDHLGKVTALKLSAHRRVYENVLDLRDRVSLIQRYQDRSFSVLEMLRLVTLSKSETMTFLSFTFRQKQSIRLTGLADATGDVYSFKETLQKDERIRDVKINRLVQDSRSRRQRFDIDITFAAEEEMQ